MEENQIVKLINSNMDTIGKRIEAIRSHLNLTQTKFAELLGIRQASLSQLINGKTRPDVETLKKIVKLSGCNYEFLVDGHGGLENLPTGFAIPIKMEEREIPYFNLSAQAGFIEHFQDSSEEFSYENFKLPNGLNMGEIAFEVLGPSMEDRIKEKAVVVCTKVKSKDWSYLPSNLNDIYVILYGDFLSVKYVINKINTAGVIELHSHNKELYPPETVAIDNVRNIWRVVTVIQTP